MLLPTNLLNLAIAINKVSGETGVSAVSSADNSRLILISDDGDDVAISQVGTASPSFFGRLIDKSGVAETSTNRVSYFVWSTQNTISSDKRDH